MKLPVIRGVIERRILVNYRVEPSVLARTLPAPFRPKIYRGCGLVGICLIRLRGMRPRYVPSWIGVASENAAHRTAVEWDADGNRQQGVYVRRRDTSSWLNALSGGRIFPGIHNHAKFVVEENEGQLKVALRSDDGVTQLSVAGKVVQNWSTNSIFDSLAEASQFFQSGALGYSATPDPTRFQGLELRCDRWHVEPLAVSEVRSSYFDDRKIFPAGSIEFDCGLLMRGIDHEWHGRSDLCCEVHQPT